VSVGAEKKRERPRAFAEDWSAVGTPRPPTSVANPLGAAGRVEPAPLRSVSVGERFRRYEIDELAGAPSVDRRGGIDLSPDGREVAFAWDRDGQLELYAAPLVGERIIQLTEAGKRSFAPSWSPDGHWIAFLRDEGDGRARIRLVDRDGERERELASAEDAARSAVAWSPDSARVTYATARDRSEVHVVDVASGADRRIAEGSTPRWSPDGRWILFSRRNGSEDLFIASPDGADARLLDTRGGAAGRATGGEWSPDGQAVAFATNVRGRWEIAIAHLRDDVVARLERCSATPYDDVGPVWRPDGRGVVYRHVQDGNVSLRRVFTISHADEAVADLPGTHWSPHLALDSETVVAILERTTRPADIVVRPFGALDATAITTSLPPSFDVAALVEPVHVRYAQRDGRDLFALVYLPHLEAYDRSRLPPAVVLADPGERVQRGWRPIAQLLANRGFVVMAAEIRDRQDERRAADWVRAQALAEKVAERPAPRFATAGGKRAARIGTAREYLAWAESELARA
jgi:Tol biopolymer transport system component